MIWDFIIFVLQIAFASSWFIFLMVFSQAIYHEHMKTYHKQHYEEDKDT
jgi:hypothetical protein